MIQIFLTILSMSLTASLVALIVILARLALKKSPKIFSYALWAAVLFRMLSPVAIESSIGFSRPVLLPMPQEYPVPPFMPQELTSFNVSVEIPASHDLDSMYITILPSEAAPNIGVGVGTDILQTLINAAPFVWLLGIAVLIGYAVLSYVKIKRQIFVAVRVRDNIYESGRVNSPFVIGFFRPRIIIPTGLTPHETDYVILHEKTHIRRGDHFIKLIAFAGLALHWFNPLMWVSYFLMARDMELSCDESVMRKAGTDIRQGYSNSLLNMCVRQSGIPNPLSFCESNVKSRIKNVLGFKKCSRFIAAISAFFTALIIGVCVVNGASPANTEFFTEPDRSFVAGTSRQYVRGETFVWQVSDSERQAAENFLADFLSGYNLENHYDGRFQPNTNRNARNLVRQNSADTIIVEYMRPRPTWHNITSFVRFDAAPGEVSPHMYVLLDNIPRDNSDISWLVASYRADTWEIHALYSFANNEHRLVKIATWPRLFYG